MAKYCFAERARELYNEATVRGLLAAFVDFPRLMDRDECVGKAMAVGEALRADVCCIPTGNASYQHLVSTAWVSGYCVSEQLSDRELMRFAMSFKPLQTDEALAELRYLCSIGLQDEIDRVYATYVKLTEAMKRPV